MGTSKHYFNKLNLPKVNYIEASRLFIDKECINLI